MNSAASTPLLFHSFVASVLGAFTKWVPSGTLGVTAVGLHTRSSQLHQFLYLIGGSKLPQVTLRSTAFSITGSVSRIFNKHKQATLARACCGRYLYL